MKLLAALISFFIYFQFQLWFGDGNLLEVWHLHQKVEVQQKENAELKHRNLELIAHVESLRTGTEAIEEFARNELGMIQKDETFYQIIE